MSREEASAILRSLNDDLERAANLRNIPDQKEARADAMEAALVVLLEALSEHSAGHPGDRP